MSTKRSVATFPMVGPWDIPPCDPASAEMALHCQTKVFHWLYHIEAREENEQHYFRLATRDWLTALVHCLGLNGRPLQTSPLEYVPDSYHGELLSSISLPIPHFQPENYSFAAAMATTLVAAAMERPLPSWAAFTGCLPKDPRQLNGQLRFTSTGEIEKKIQIVLGRERPYDCSPIIEQIYAQNDKPVVERVYGPRNERVIPRKVKLFFTPSELDVRSGWTEQIRTQLGLEYVDASLADFGHSNFTYLLRRIEQLIGGDGMLVVQVPTVWHILRLLGYHHSHPLVIEKLKEFPDKEHFNVYRILRERRDRPSHRNTNEQRQYEPQLREALRDLDHDLRHIPNIHARLSIITRHCVKHVRGRAGYIARIKANEPDWLSVEGGPWDENFDLPEVERHMDFPKHLPRHEGFDGAVLNRGLQIAVSQQQLMDFHVHDPNPSLLVTRYGEDKYRSYMQLIATIPACVGLQLKQGQQPIGVLCLSLQEEGTIDPGELYVVQGLAKRAESEIATLLTEEEAGLLWNLDAAEVELQEFVRKLQDFA